MRAIRQSEYQRSRSAISHMLRETADYALSATHHATLVQQQQQLDETYMQYRNMLQEALRIIEQYEQQALQLRQAKVMHKRLMKLHGSKAKAGLRMITMAENITPVPY
jgi:hypothetical protein